MVERRQHSVERIGSSTVKRSHARQVDVAMISPGLVMLDSVLGSALVTEDSVPDTALRWEAITASGVAGAGAALVEVDPNSDSITRQNCCC